MENLEEEDDNLSEDQKKELGETQKELYRIVEDRIRGEYIRARIVEVIEEAGGREWYQRVAKRTGS